MGLWGFCWRSCRGGGWGILGRGRGERGRVRVGSWDVFGCYWTYSLFIVVMCLSRKGASRQGNQLSFSLSKKGFDQMMGEEGSLEHNWKACCWRRYECGQTVGERQGSADVSLSARLCLVVPTTRLLGKAGLMGDEIRLSVSPCAISQASKRWIGLCFCASYSGGGHAIGCWKSEALDVCGLPPLLHVDARLWGWENREIR